MKSVFVLAIAFCILTIAHAQQFTSNNWFFGYNAGVDFNFGISTVVSGGQVQTFEGCATVGDDAGNLLFYTDGVSVWNKNHQVMPNGSGLHGHFSVTQAAIIVPYPDSANLFYIFTIYELGHPTDYGLQYSIVDMNLDTGLGDITSVKNASLEPNVSEKMVAIEHENSGEKWVLCHKWDSNNFLAYHITSVGLDTIPVVSSIGSMHQGGGTNGLTNTVGYMKSNLNGTKIALALYGYGIIELFDFDSSTGEVSNCISSPGILQYAYGIEFSPNGNLLYASTIFSNSRLFQFDLSLPNPLDSPIYVLSSPSTLQIHGLQIAPDGKIYVSERYSNYLSVINNPNLPGPACEYEAEAIYLNGNTCRSGLPPNVNLRAFEFVTGSLSDTTICDGDSVLFGNNYVGDDGMYRDTIVLSLGWDSIVNLNLNVLTSPPVPLIYDNQGVLSTDGGFNYQWYYYGIPISGGTYNIFNPQALGPGEYQVEVTNQNGCSSVSDVYSYVLSSDEIEPDNFMVFPIPASGSITIEGSGNLDIEIRDIYGKRILSKNKISNPYQLDISKLKSGVYWIQVNSNETTFARKILIVD